MFQMMENLLYVFGSSQSDLMNYSWKNLLRNQLMSVIYHIAYMFTNTFLTKTLTVIVALLLFPEASSDLPLCERLCMSSAGYRVSSTHKVQSQNVSAGLGNRYKDYTCITA